ncbi:hypothetical protein BAE44_0020685 [Dichanthelium oligosanthes]|uniref:Uncharacterized protein n=1 Tax=Dichanthelium oligosanthes TaxID=888268 RepID=A0A1E5UZV0_9POAL|nr:hypothetical protein BAE44_0020685 [Dichanthelium oligosanthes]
MLNSTVELITLWPSSSPSLLAFCFSHLIVGVIFLGAHGEWNAGADGAETVDGVQAQGGKRSGGGQSALSVAEHRHTPAPDVDGRAKRCVAEVDTGAVQLEASEESSRAEEVPADADTAQEKCGDDEEDDELMMRAEEFIQRMNRVWRAENVASADAFGTWYACSLASRQNLIFLRS